MSAVPVWLCGVFICLFGSTLTALGLVLQKHSHSGRTEEDGAGYWKDPRWVCGFLIFVSAQLINMVSMAMTPQVVLSCLGSWTLVCNTVFARLILGESIGCKQGATVVGLMGSSASVVYNAPRPGDVQLMQIAELTARFISPEFLGLSLFALCISALLRALVLGASCCGAASKAEDQADRFGLAEAAEPERAAALVTRTLEPASWAMSAALAAGYTAMLFKCISEIIAGAPRASPSPWWCWETYVIIAAALSCGPLELHCLNLALQKGEAVFVIPTYLALGMIAQLLTGGVFFQELRNFEGEGQAVSFALSVMLTLTCVVGMALVQEDEPGEEEGGADGDAGVASGEALDDAGSRGSVLAPLPKLPDHRVRIATAPSSCPGTPLSQGAGQPLLTPNRARVFTMGNLHPSSAPHFSSARPRIVSAAGFSAAVQLSRKRTGTAGRVAATSRFDLDDEFARLSAPSASDFSPGSATMSPTDNAAGRVLSATPQGARPTALSHI